MLQALDNPLEDVVLSLCYIQTKFTLDAAKDSDMSQDMVTRQVKASQAPTPVGCYEEVPRQLSSQRLTVPVNKSGKRLVLSPIIDVGHHPMIVSELHRRVAAAVNDCQQSDWAS